MTGPEVALAVDGGGLAGVAALGLEPSCLADVEGVS